jgi:predicted MPP superfamily phosphohydrolase
LWTPSGKISLTSWFFSGDLIDHFNIYAEDVSLISEILSEVQAPLGKFAIFGNHDYGGAPENEYESIMEAGGFTVLKNEYYAIPELDLAMIGIDDVIIGYGNPSISSWGRPDYFNIVLSHARM